MMTTEFKMVPLVPTEEMLYAASWVHGPGGMGEVKHRIGLEYRAALAAAPEPPKQDGIPAGVVLPEKYDESQYRGTSLLAVRRWNQCVDEVVRLNLAAAPASPQAAQPVAGIEGMPMYLILFDDAEVPVETMFGDEIARKRFAQISGNWNAHLFVKVQSNSRDDRHAGANHVCTHADAGEVVQLKAEIAALKARLGDE